MRDTGVFRAHARPAAYSLADLCAGIARPLRSRLVEYGGHKMWLQEPGPALMSSTAWFNHLLVLCKTRARKALDKAGARYEKEMDRRIQRITALIQPVIIVVIALVVGAVVYSIITSIFDAMSGMRKNL
jgi:hypothetical protein